MSQRTRPWTREEVIHNIIIIATKFDAIVPLLHFVNIIMECDGLLHCCVIMIMELTCEVWEENVRIDFDS